MTQYTSYTYHLCISRSYDIVCVCLYIVYVVSFYALLCTSTQRQSSCSLTSSVCCVCARCAQMHNSSALMHTHKHTHTYELHFLLRTENICFDVQFYLLFLLIIITFFRSLSLSLYLSHLLHFTDIFDTVCIAQLFELNLN